MAPEPAAPVAQPTSVMVPVMQYAAPVYYAPTAPNPTYAAPAVSAFDMLDRNHDGVITQAEFNQAMQMQAYAAPAATYAAPTYAAPAATYSAGQSVAYGGP